MKTYLYILCLLMSSICFSQEKSYSEVNMSVSKFIDGTLLKPNNSKNPILAIIIAGSGPTDRNGNQNFLKNNALKKLADSLTTNGIATFRYDKRIVKQIKQGNIDKSLSFDDFVTDAKATIAYFKNSGAYKKIYVIGHSQGSLVGMLAAKDLADGFISLAGAGQNIGNVIVEQVSKMDSKLGEEAQNVVNQLKQGKTTTNYPQALASIFNTDLQVFMISWMQYHPDVIIKALQLPILIINGTKDLQVSTQEAQRLKDANPKATLKLIENMNHVLFNIEGGDLENSKSYNETFRPISGELVKHITNFIKR